MHLVQNHISSDTRTAFEELAAAAAAGHIIGSAVVVILKRKRYFVDFTGVARDNPSDTRGMVAALDDCLRDMVHKSANENPTL